MVKKLSEFQDEKAIQIVAELLEPVSVIASDKAMKENKSGNLFGFAQKMCELHAKEVKTILAVLSETEPSEYHCTAASVFADTVKILNDEELLRLFNLQTQTVTSSVSA